MLTEDELPVSEDLLKKTNYSKNKTTESEAEMSTSSDELVLAGMVAASLDGNTDWLYSSMIFFFANATNKFTKHLPVIALHSCDSKFSRLSQKLWQKLQR